MAETFTFLLYAIFTSCACLTITLYLYFTHKYGFWRRLGVPFVKPSIPFGNLGPTFTLKKAFGETYAFLYTKIEEMKCPGYVGVYQLHMPILILGDPDLIKTILVKDFQHFHDHGTSFVEECDPLSAHLFMLNGLRWKNMRFKLTPTFTSGKMKMMFGTVLQCGEQLQTCIKTGGELEVKDIMARFTTDVIASCAFGIQCNCLHNPNAEFREWGRKIFEPTAGSNIRNFTIFCLPNIASILKLPMIPKSVTKFFLRAIHETVEHRETNSIKRNDFMQLLIELKHKGAVDIEHTATSQDNTTSTQSNTGRLTMQELAAQAFLFYFAGFETSSTTLTFCLYELALNLDIQDKLRDEIDQVLSNYDNKLTYESLQEMAYLDKVVAETLRKYPPLPFLNRICTKRYRLPDSNVVLDKGVRVFISVSGIHSDPKYYPNPNKFDPERFSDAEKEKRHPYVYLPFGEGPRNCIGMRFGLMQTKVGLAFLLSRYEFHPCEKTPIPLRLDPKMVFPTALGGMWLKVSQRSNN